MIGAMELLRGVTLVLATVLTGLAAGVFCTYSTSVVWGLRATDDATFVFAMRRINIAIVNGWFLASFVGAPIVVLLAGLLQLGADDRSPLPWIVAGFALYAVAFVLTMAVNVPLNNALDRAGDHPPDPGTARTAFEKPWLRWNHVRTLASLAGFTCLVIAVVRYGGASS